MNTIAWMLLLTPVLLGVYAYLGYPLCLWLLGFVRARRAAAPPPAEWPAISITLAAYNEAQQIRESLSSLLRADYPSDRRQILVVSDASTDGTDEIVAEYADRGVELLRLATRGGKGVAEREAAPHLRGEIIVNTDASIRIHPQSIKRLVAQFSDPTVGLASGRDVSAAALEEDANRGEAGYVGYEMGVRRLESRVGGIVGASGCFYAIRAHLHRAPLPRSLSRDFAAAMIAREHGYRALSVDEATCVVPRATSLRREYHRKVRTITRGMETLLFKRHLLNPLRYGLFAWMLGSHKITRWLAAQTLPLAVVGIALLSFEHTWARVALAAALLSLAWAATGWMLSRGETLPRFLSLPAFALMGNVAALHAGFRVLHGDENSIWEPTRRPTAVAE